MLKLLQVFFVSLALPLAAFASGHGEHLNRHAELAKRSRGDLSKRQSFADAKFSFYDVGLYVPTIFFFSLFLIAEMLTTGELVEAITLDLTL